MAAAFMVWISVVTPMMRSAQEGAVEEEAAAGLHSAEGAVGEDDAVGDVVVDSFVDGAGDGAVEEGLIVEVDATEELAIGFGEVAGGAAVNHFKCF